MKELYRYIYSDFYRYSGRRGVRSFFVTVLLFPTFRYSLVLRVCKYLKGRRITKYTVYPFFRIMLVHCQNKYHIDIPETVSIGYGFCMHHLGGIVINGKTVIGKNFKALPYVLIGENSRGKKQGAPVIGDNVHIGAGVKIIGGVRIGNNANIGANAVVVDDVPDNAVVVGIPAKVISYEGSASLIGPVDYF